MSLMTTPGSKFGSNKDRADVSVLELHGHSRSDFCQLILNQTYCYLPTAISEEWDILLSGFPYAPNIDTDERTVTLRSYMHHTRILASERRVLKAGYLPAFHHVVEYRRRDIRPTTGERVLTPEPYGLSGGGMWVLSTDAEGMRSYRLIGVNIEYYRDSSVFAAVQINHVLRFMKPIDDLRAAAGQ
ncbi:MAG: hypothetical protein HS115_12420 [Spirochaetales bacterium]|nr:hypothetical protein [Spirochaetales bacterium]